MENSINTTKNIKEVNAEKICIVPQQEMIERKPLTVSLKEMLITMESQPEQKMIYPGITENSIGFVFGPSKSGKTTFCENLGMSIAAGLDSYLGKAIKADNRKVLFISLEEFCSGRTSRNNKQVKKIITKVGNDEWLNNFIVANCDIPRYILSDGDWKKIKTEIEFHKPGIVFLDSLTRLQGDGNIEDSVIANAVMKKLREMANELKTTIVIIHHTPKIGSAPLTIYSLAGSRVLAQEAEFMIGINKTVDKKVYIKDVSFRYAPDDSETVQLVKMDSDQWLTFLNNEDEAKLLSAFDGRRDDSNKEVVYHFIEERGGVNHELVDAKVITDGLVGTGKISKPTLFDQLKSLKKEGRIEKVGRGKYKLAA